MNQCTECPFKTDNILHYIDHIRHKHPELAEFLEIEKKPVSEVIDPYDRYY